MEPVFVGDVAEAVALLAERSAPLPTYEFGGAHVYTYRELVEAIPARYRSGGISRQSRFRFGKAWRSWPSLCPGRD